MPIFTPVCALLPIPLFARLIATAVIASLAELLYLLGHRAAVTDLVVQPASKFVYLARGQSSDHSLGFRSFLIDFHYLLLEDCQDCLVEVNAALLLKDGGHFVILNTLAVV